jgi:hypothetical protein
MGLGILETLHSESIDRVSLYICHVHNLVLISIAENTRLLKMMAALVSDCLGSSSGSATYVLCDLEQNIKSLFLLLK